jgi:phosphoribosylformylglycinamidine cyclo-ligase
VFNIEHAKLDEWSEELGGELGGVLLQPTAIYVKPVLAAIEAAQVHGVSHITGGGFYENIPRCLPKGMTAKIDKSALWINPIFRMIQRLGNIPEHDMFNTFNMGTGMVLVVAKEDVDKAVAALNSEGEGARVIGEIVAGDAGVELL